MEKNLKNSKGITLIALVVTIIVLLILAGISIMMLTGNNGILTRTAEAKEEYNFSAEDEEIKMIYMGLINNDLKVNFSEFENKIKEKFGEDTRIEKNDNYTTGKVEYFVTLPNGNEHVLNTNHNIVDVVVLEEDTDTLYQNRVYGYSMKIEEELSLRIYLIIDNDKFNSGKETIRVESDYFSNVNNSIEHNNQIIEVNSENLKKQSIDSKEYYYIDCNCDLFNVGFDFNIKFYNDGIEDSEEYSYSLFKYGMHFVENRDYLGTIEKEKLCDFCNAFLNLCASSQKYFNSTVPFEISDYIEEIDVSNITYEYVESLITEDLITYTDNSFSNSSKVKLAVSLMMNMPMGINYYFSEIKTEDLNNSYILCDGQRINKENLKYENNKCMFSYKVNFKDFSHSPKVELYAEDNTLIASISGYSILNYCRGKIKNGSDIELSNLCKYLIYFIENYQEYFA